MGVMFDFSDVERELSNAKTYVKGEFEAAGELAVEYAKEHGNYQNRTGKLRKSNKYKATSKRLTIENTADYASDVEAKGYDVLSGAFLQVLNLLK